MVKNRLLEIRLSRGYKKQKEFAEFIKVSSVTYNKWENNSSQPTLENLLNISKELNLKIEDIIYDDSIDK